MYYPGDFVVFRESREVKRLGRVLAIVQQDNRMKIKIQRIYTFEELPRNLQSNSRRQRSLQGEVWFLDQEMDDAIVIAELQAIAKRLLISILYENDANDPNPIKIRDSL